jgi:iron(III) transport system substrate-binding protein
MRKRMVGIMLGSLLLLMPGGGATPATAAQGPENLVIFSGRREPLLTPVLQLFQQQTGIQVTVKFGSTTALAQEILQLQDARRPVPDVFLANDAGTLEFLQVTREAFQSYTSPAIERIPERFRAPDGSWLGISGRSRVIIYNRDLVKPEELPSTAFDLIHSQWRGKIAVSNASDTDGFVPWVSALRLTLGDELTKAFLLKLKENQITILSEQTDIRKAVGRGEFALGLINNYYVYLQRHESEPAVRNVGILYHDQGPFQLGTLLNATGAAIVKGATHQEDAQRFLDFLVSPDAQKLFAELNFEYPLLPGVSIHPEVVEDLPAGSLDALKQMPISPADLGRELEATQQLLEEVGWF